MGAMTRVLVIDDCEEFCEVVSELLDDAGYQVTVVSDSDQALALCEGQEFEVVLCDLVMPLPGDEQVIEEEDGSAMVGLHVVSQLHEKFPHIPIIIISGQLVGGPLAALQQFGAQAALSKPFGQDELVATIERGIAK